MGLAIFFVIAAGCALLALLPRYMVAVVAWLLGTALIAPSFRNTARLMENRDANRTSAYDQEANHTERRRMRQGLRFALGQAELRSLFPGVVACAEATAARWVRL